MHKYLYFRTAGAIRGRCGRICGVVTAEMDNYEPGYYTERVLDTVGLLSGQVLPNFAARVEGVIGMYFRITVRKPFELMIVLILLVSVGLLYLVQFVFD